MGDDMTLAQAAVKLQEMHVLEEKLLEILTAPVVVYHENDLKTIVSKILEVCQLIIKLTVMIHEAKKRGDNRI